MTAPVSARVTAARTYDGHAPWRREYRLVVTNAILGALCFFLAGTTGLLAVSVLRHGGL